MKLSVFGVGYVGLVTAACFADLGNEVLGCDVDEQKIAALREGRIPIYEPGLEEIVKRTVAAGRLKFTTDAAEASQFGEVIFIGVGTPSAPDGSADLKYVRSAIDTLGEHLAAAGTVIVMKSTVPVGTGAEMRARLAEKLAARGAAPEFAMVSNPEFLREGSAIQDFMQPDRIVVGAEEPWAREKMAELYKPLTDAGRPLLFMDRASSEMSKYASNTMLAAKISFINQIAGLCEILGADVEKVRDAMAADARIGPHFLNPGLGYGGSCFPKDVQALALLARTKGAPSELIEAIESVNERHKVRLVERAAAALGGLKNKKIALWGLAFKPNTDDMRQAPSIAVTEALLAAGASVSAYDPAATEEARKLLGDRIAYAADKYDALEDADALFVVTEWAEFREPDFEKMAAALRAKNVFDGRNIYDPEKMKELGFTYASVGRK